MKKIILVTDSFSSGGAQKQMIMLANGLSDTGIYEIITIQYYNYNFFDDMLSQKIRIEKCFVSNKITRAFSILRFLNKEKPDVIISFLHGPNNYSAIYRLLFFWRNVFFIAGERNLNVDKLKLKDFLIRFSHVFANKIVCNSYAQRTKLIPYFRNKLTVIPNGTNIDGIVKKTDYEKKKTCRFIVPARFIDQKNPLGLLNALSQTDNIKVDWYGEVFENYSIYKKALDLIEQKNLHAKFEIFSPTSDIYNTLISYDAMILPSFYEGCPNAIIDAMLCGLPVLASDVSDNKIYLEKQKELLFDPNSVNDIVDKINVFKEMSAVKRASIGTVNYDDSRVFFDNKTMVDNYLSLIP